MAFWLSEFDLLPIQKTDLTRSVLELLVEQGYIGFDVMEIISSLCFYSCNIISITSTVTTDITS